MNYKFAYSLILLSAFLCSCAHEAKDSWPTPSSLRLAYEQNGFTKEQIEAPKRVKHLSDIHFTSDTTKAQVTAIWGVPDGFGGSGIDYWYYKMKDGGAVSISYDYRPPERVIDVFWKKPGAERGVLIFDCGQPSK